MKIKNKLLVLLSLSLLTAPTLLVVACKTSPNTSDKKTKALTDAKFKEFIDSIKSNDDISKYADIVFQTINGTKKLSEVLPSKVNEDPKNLKVQFRNNSEYGSIKADVTNVSIEKGQNSITSNINGTLKVFITFTNKTTNKKISKEILFTGLDKNSGLDHQYRQIGDKTAYFGDKLEEYLNNWNQTKRFKFDNEKYISSLENHLNDGKSGRIDLKQKYSLNTSEENIKKFNDKAEELKFDSYYNAALKGFTLPVYDSRGNVEGLKINDAQEVGKIRSITDVLSAQDEYKTNGLARTLVNSTYKTIAEQTFQVKFTHLKDFAEEIAQAKEYIEQIQKWSPEELKQFKDKELHQLKLNYETEKGQIEFEISKLLARETGIKDNKQKQLKELQEKYEKEKKELEDYQNNNLVEWQKKRIKDFEKERDQKNKYGKTSGTMWIMDYQIDESKKGATKFYFGTNSHVAKAINDSTTTISLTRMKKEVQVGQTFRLNHFDPSFETFNFEINKDNRDAVTAIFHATDFLKESPLQYLTKDQKQKYKDKDAGIFADFAVIEIDFEKLIKDLKNNNKFWVTSAGQPIDKYKNMDAKKLAKAITNDYENSNNKVKFKSDSYLTNYDQIDRKLSFNSSEEKDKQLKDKESLYILGYPSSDEDYYLDKYENEKEIENKKYDFSLWINTDSKYYNKVSTPEGQKPNFTEEELDRGNYLSYQIGYRSFIDKPGLTDAFLSAHRIGRDLYKLTTKENGKKITKQYFNFGLELMPSFYAPIGGASGSSVRNKNNELIAVFHASNPRAVTGLAAMFRSPGYDYQGLFGEYKLPKYDLIYGGSKEQKNSYRDALKEKYKDNTNFKTQLFEHGLEEDKIPEAFKFK